MSLNISAEIALPENLYRADQVRELDRLAIAGGIPGFDLMSRAGQAAFGYLQERWPEKAPIEVFCGGGNNGGDGYVVAALAAESGVPVRVWALSDKLDGDALLARQWAERQGVAIAPWCGGELSPQAVVVDALLGTGLNGEVRPAYAEAIAAINASGAPVLAIDIPSGLGSDNGMRMGECIRASATITFIGLKQGLFSGDAADHIGELVFNDLAVPRDVYQQLQPSARRSNKVLLMDLLGRRPRVAHKGLFGHVLVVGGDHGYAGAALMAAAAAARSGAGLVSCATRSEHLAAFTAARPEVMVRGVDGAADLKPLLASATVVVAGPGLGQSDWGRALLAEVLKVDKPVLFDADALNLIGERQGLAGVSAPRIITPHPGEAGRLLSCSTVDVQRDRFASALELARRYKSTVVLKGAGSIIASEGELFVNVGGNPGMASGGMGDVLSGIIGALLAQGLSAAAACCLGAALHGAAADLAAEDGERGLLAMDVVEKLRVVVNGHSMVSG